MEEGKGAVYTDHCQAEKHTSLRDQLVLDIGQLFYYSDMQYLLILRTMHNIIASFEDLRMAWERYLYSSSQRASITSWGLLSSLPRLERTMGKKN